MDDEKILDLYWQRSELAIAATADKYSAYCSRIAMNILDSEQDAAECLNDTWLHTWNAVPPHRPARLVAFLGKITRELALGRYKARMSQKRGSGETALALDELEQVVAGGDTVEQAMESALLGKAISDFLRTQPSDAADVFVRRYYHFCPIAQIAKEYSMSVSKVKSMLLRLRKKLRIYLESEGITP